MKKQLIVSILLSVTNAASYTTTLGGPTFSIEFDSNSAEYLFKVDSPIGQDLWLAYSTDCDKTECDIVQWSTSGVG